MVESWIEAFIEDLTKDLTEDFVIPVAPLVVSLIIYDVRVLFYSISL